MEHDFPAIGKKMMLLNAYSFESVDNHPNLILLAIEDISERKHAEVELRQTEQRKDSFWIRYRKNSLPPSEGSVDYFNPQWMEYTGLSFEQLRDWGRKQIIHPTTKTNTFEDG